MTNKKPERMKYGALAPSKLQQAKMAGYNQACDAWEDWIVKKLEKAYKSRFKKNAISQLIKEIKGEG